MHTESYYSFIRILHHVGENVKCYTINKINDGLFCVQQNIKLIKPYAIHFVSYSHSFHLMPLKQK